ncbi:MAG TPA: hypothetical protein VF961_06565, partial [Pyrinomonadaceae bacterium]
NVKLEVRIMAEHVSLEISLKIQIGVRLAILRFSISGEIIRRVSRPRWPRVQAAVFLGRFNLDVAE